MSEWRPPDLSRTIQKGIHKLKKALPTYSGWEKDFIEFHLSMAIIKDLQKVSLWKQDQNLQATIDELDALQTTIICEMSIR